MAEIPWHARRKRVALERSWRQFIDGAEPEPGTARVREEVLQSWTRSSAALPPTIDHAPFVEDAPAQWWEGLLGRAFASVSEDLAKAADDGRLVAGATDAEGTVVWTAGDRLTLQRAEQVAFTPGGRWDESSVGTNAVALALKTGAPSVVWATEHYAPFVQDWVCYSAPILDPWSGSTLGVLDLSTRWSATTPLALPTVAALARVMGLALRADVDPTMAFPERSALVLRTLGTSEVTVGGLPVLLSPRQIELLVVLSLSPDGLSLEQLHDEVHGDRPVSPSTTKAELSHLRRVVGPVIASRPYRIDTPVHADHLELLEALEDGRLDDALDWYRGPLLERSSAEAVVDQRHLIDVAIREAVIADSDGERLLRLSAVMSDDAYLQECTLAVLDAGDPRRGPVEGRLACLN
ncbi:MAG TPA: hypothetical protein VJM33_09900 [Microthrixaceae bacterium]|nr:hypothetical protein [Microthrixaceae bacterium]